MVISEAKNLRSFKALRAGTGRERLKGERRKQEEAEGCLKSTAESLDRRKGAYWVRQSEIQRRI